MKNLLKEFKTFALRGNVMDLAVGVIIGAAFGKIVTSLVEDLIMPIIGAVWNVDFSSQYVGLSRDVRAAIATAAEQAGQRPSLVEVRRLGLGPVFAYGNFLTVFLNFIIVAFSVFLLVKALNRLIAKRDAAPAPSPELPPDVKLLTEIRDLLKQREGLSQGTSAKAPGM
jgi:large conductance mechanosensitive channel